MQYRPPNVSDYPLTEILAQVLSTDLPKGTDSLTFKNSLQKGRVTLVEPAKNSMLSVFNVPEYIEREYIDYTPASTLHQNDKRNLVGIFQNVPVRVGSSFYSSESSGVTLLGKTTYDNINFNTVAFNTNMFEDTGELSIDVFIDLICLRNDKYLTPSTGCIAYAQLFNKEIQKIVLYYHLPIKQLLSMIDIQDKFKLSKDIKIVDKTLGQL